MSKSELISNTLRHGFTKKLEFFRKAGGNETIRHVFAIDFGTSNEMALGGVSGHSSDHRTSHVRQITSIAKLLRFQYCSRNASKSGLQGIRETVGARTAIYTNSGRFQTRRRIN